MVDDERSSTQDEREDLPLEDQSIEQEDESTSVDSDALAEARAQAQDYLSHLQRVQADFINYRGRIEQERVEARRFSNAELIKRILPILDDLDRAEANRPDGQGDSPEARWAEGVLQTVRKLEKSLAAEGVTRIEAVGREFDPSEHEAVMQQETAPDMAGKVVSEAQTGYRLHDRVLRPAMVVVGKAATEQVDDDTEKAGSAADD
jgi:molecular chaperone GrpE